VPAERAIWPPLPGFISDIVDDGADRHLAELHGIARLHVDLAAGEHRVARRSAAERGCR
jgi:hypothetical protein